MTETEPVLHSKDVSTGYGTNEIVHEVSLRVNDGESVCIIGPNGAGKSTLLKALTGYLPCWDGEVRLNGTDVTDFATEDLVAHGLSLVPQGDNIFPDMTVKEHLNLGAWLIDDETKQQNISEVLEIFPQLEDRLNQTVKTMSGGEQQMVSLARAMVVDPAILVLDEPSLGLAPDLVSMMFDLITQIQDSGVSVLMVEQNASQALKHTHRGYVLEMGDIRFEGASRALLENKDVKRMYLGG